MANYTKIVNGVSMPCTPEEIAEFEAEAAVLEAARPERERQAHNAPILAEIADLDRFIPRGLEDLLSVLAVDVTTLPQVQQDRLARKAALRGQLQ